MPTGIYKHKPLSQKHKLAISIANKNKIFTAEYRKKLSLASIGIKKSPNHCLNISLSHKGKISPRKGVKLSIETKNKISKSRKGIKPNKETREKLRNSFIKRIKRDGHPVLGKHWKLTEEQKKNRPKYFGENNSSWRGGKSFEKYNLEWTKQLRAEIRKRDNYICQICGIKEIELTGRIKKLSVHHIDYNKENCSLNNLISLCNSCHIKTNSKRDYWSNYFNILLK